MEERQAKIQQAQAQIKKKQSEISRLGQPEKKSKAWIIIVIIIIVVLIVAGVLIWLFVFRKKTPNLNTTICTLSQCSDLDTPTNFIGSPGDGLMVLVWTQPDRCADFWQVYISDQPNVTTASTLAATVTTTSYISSTVSPGTYYARVRAGKNIPAGCFSALSSEVTVVVSTCTIPAAPVISSGASCGTGCVGVVWTAVSKATSYNVYLREEADPTPLLYDEKVTVTGTSHQFTGQPPLINLHVGLTAVNHCGESPMSNIHIEFDP